MTGVAVCDRAAIDSTNGDTAAPPSSKMNVRLFTDALIQVLAVGFVYFAAAVAALGLLSSIPAAGEHPV